MALDEPNQSDMVVETGACRFLLAPDVSEVVRQMGGVQVDFVDETGRKGYTIRFLEKNCGGSCDCSH